MSWDELLKEGEKTLNIVKKGLIKRGLKAGNSIKTTYGVVHKSIFSKIVMVLLVIVEN